MIQEQEETISIQSAAIRAQGEAIRAQGEAIQEQQEALLFVRDAMAECSAAVSEMSARSSVRRPVESDSDFDLGSAGLTWTVLEEPDTSELVFVTLDPLAPAGDAHYVADPDGSRWYWTTTEEDVITEAKTNRVSGCAGVSEAAKSTAYSINVHIEDGENWNSCHRCVIEALK